MLTSTIFLTGEIVSKHLVTLGIRGVLFKDPGLRPLRGGVYDIFILPLRVFSALPERACRSCFEVVTAIFSEKNTKL